MAPLRLTSERWSGSQRTQAEPVNEACRSPFPRIDRSALPIASRFVSRPRKCQTPPRPRPGGQRLKSEAVLTVKICVPKSPSSQATCWLWSPPRFAHRSFLVLRPPGSRSQVVPLFTTVIEPHRLPWWGNVHPKNSSLDGPPDIARRSSEIGFQPGPQGESAVISSCPEPPLLPLLSGLAGAPEGSCFAIHLFPKIRKAAASG